MHVALEEARLAAGLSEVPVGAVVVREGKLIARAGNRREMFCDPTAHAEMLALRQAAAVLGTRRLSGCTLYVTLEPCPMCAGAVALAQLDAVYFGAADPGGGCCGSVYRLTEDRVLRLGIVSAYGGVLAKECAALLDAFFLQRRQET